MTEAEWKSSRSASELLRMVRGRVSHRKLRLLACAWCRRFWNDLSPRQQQLIEVTERFADRHVSDRDFLAAFTRPRSPLRRSWPRDELADAIETLGWADAEPEGWTNDPDSLRGAASFDPHIPGLYAEFLTNRTLLYLASAARTIQLRAHFQTVPPEKRIPRLAPRSREPVEQWKLFRDVIGNSLKPIVFDPSWRTEAVVALARGMYESRDFAPMPVLADALEDAGCGDPDVLAHCRGGGPHVRGCWVVDLVLGKE